MLSYITVLHERGHLSFGHADDFHLRSLYGLSRDKVRKGIPEILQQVNAGSPIKLAVTQLPLWSDKLEELWPPFQLEKDLLCKVLSEKANQLYQKLEHKFTLDEFNTRHRELYAEHSAALSELIEQHTELWLDSDSVKKVRNDSDDDQKTPMRNDSD